MDTMIEVSPGESRVALVDPDGHLARLDIDRVTWPRMLHGIWRGRVTRIEKAMQGAFVDLGSGGEVLIPKARDGKGRPLTEGQWIVLQISREAQPGKGPAAQTRLQLVDRYLAYQPFGSGIEYDRSLGNGRDRAEIEGRIETLGLAEKGGWLVRAAAAAAPDPALAACVRRLTDRWAAIQAENDGQKPKQLEAPPALLDRIIRDTPPAGRVATDDRALFGMLEKAVRDYPDLAEGLAFHRGEEPLFEEAGIEEDIDRALQRRLRLDGGGELVFDAAEAMTVIDVNLGDGAAGLSASDGAVRLNIRAAREIGRQIELRNIAGLIVIDLVRMPRRGDEKKVTDALRKALREASGGASTATTDILGMTAGGLIEVTRQRMGPPLAELMLAPVNPEREPLAEAEACALLRRALRLRGGGRPVLRAGPGVLAALNGPLKEAREEVERRLGRELTLIGQDASRQSEIAMER